MNSNTCPELVRPRRSCAECSAFRAACRVRSAARFTRSIIRRPLVWFGAVFFLAALRSPRRRSFKSGRATASAVHRISVGTPSSRPAVLPPPVAFDVPRPRTAPAPRIPIPRTSARSRSTASATCFPARRHVSHPTPRILDSLSHRRTVAIGSRSRHTA